MALPPFLSIDGADPAQQNQSLTGDNTNELFVLESTGGLGTIKGFKIKGEGGNDTLTLVGSPNGTNVFGQDGQDVITVDNKGTGSIVDSKFYGGNDNDTVRLIDVLMTGTGAGTSQIGTGDGGDEIELGGEFFNTNLFAGDGNDLVTFVSKSSYKADARAFTGDGDDTMTDGGFEVDFTNTEFGTKGGDDIVNFENSFTGQDADGMEMFLGDGDDRFEGPLSGDVTALGGAGNDIIETEDGDDSVMGGDDSDYIRTGKGNDTVMGDAGCDTIFGQDGQDSLFGNDGTDLIFGQNDNDTIDGGADADFIGGGFGDDSISGGLGVSPEPTVGDVLNDILNGPQSDADDLDDLVNEGETGICTIFTEDDTLIGNVGNDTIRGESGNDIIWAGSFDNLGGDTDEVSDIIADKFDINEEFDVGAVPVPPFEESGSGEFINDGDGPQDADDSVLGNSGNDVIFGSAGDDTLLGNEGHDIIMGNEDSDSMTGGASSDIFIQSNGDSDEVEDVQAGDNLTIEFDGDGNNLETTPDIITDFRATDGAGNIVDQIAFENWDGDFSNNLGAATAGFGDDNVVLYSGIFNALNNTFITTDNSVGPDVLAFKADDNTEGGSEISAGDFGDQAVILLGAAGQGFSSENFIAFS